MIYVTTANPSDSFSNHWSNAPDVCPECGSGDYFEAQSKVWTGKEYKEKQVGICRNCWHKFEL